MDWSPQQENVLSEIGKWIQSPGEGPQVRYVAGYAGTGKTTLAKHLAATADGTVLFAAYTGKAASVLRSKGCLGASTIHSLIYKSAGERESDIVVELNSKIAELSRIAGMSLETHPHEFEERRKAIEMRDRFRKKERPRPLWNINHESELLRASLLIVDECSMVDERMALDIESFGTKILVLGDPAQLPPVGSGGYWTSRDPDYLLTEVHRHALDSGILRLATDIREGRRIADSYGSDVTLLYAGDPRIQEMAMRSDQVLVGRNTTRNATNRRIRELREFPKGVPVIGDRVVCLRNNHELGILNGSLWDVESIREVSTDVVYMNVLSEGALEQADSIPVVAWSHHFQGRGEEIKAMGWDKNSSEEFDFGYALTVHKSQGSQWNNVCLFDESSSFGSTRKKWLYTGVTRAAESLILVNL